ncbi:MAG: 2-C-methyl-D-erythritol 4-phosphate cytidylyltransferase, partial [Desulfobacterota bacterium]|nr:2-C-methyl-D-erythritol 4-phosphate cytidylyltransferase [Thermodesulfobacteriota bacterium]
MGEKKSKLFLRLQGRPLLAWTLSLFESFKKIQKIILVVPPGEENKYRKTFLLPYNISKAKIVPGGAERQDSLWNGFQEIYPPCDLVVVHDGARPFLGKKI